MELFLPILTVPFYLPGHILRGRQFFLPTAQQGEIATLHLRYRRNLTL